MSNEQLGTGNPQDTNTVAGGLRVAGSAIIVGGVAFNGVTTAPARPSIATVPVTATTADLAALGVAVNATLSALAALGLATLT